MTRFAALNNQVSIRAPAASALLICYPCHPAVYATAISPEESPARSIRALQHRCLDSFGRVGAFHPHGLVFLCLSDQDAGIAHSARPADVRAVDQPPRR